VLHWHIAFVMLTSVSACAVYSVNLFLKSTSSIPLSFACATVIGGDIEVIHQFRMQIAMFQHAAVGWLHSVVPKLLVIKPSDFMHWYCIILTIVNIIVFVFVQQIMLSS